LPLDVHIASFAGLHDTVPRAASAAGGGGGGGGGGGPARLTDGATGGAGGGGGDGEGEGDHHDDEGMGFRMLLDANNVTQGHLEGVAPSAGGDVRPSSRGVGSRRKRSELRADEHAEGAEGEGTEDDAAGDAADAADDPDFKVSARRRAGGVAPPPPLKRPRRRGGGGDDEEEENNGGALPVSAVWQLLSQINARVGAQEREIEALKAQAATTNQRTYDVSRPGGRGGG
jgi:hypothetical protein